jgi:hypothetical protein
MVERDGGDHHRKLFSRLHVFATREHSQLSRYLDLDPPVSPRGAQWIQGPHV